MVRTMKQVERLLEKRKSLRTCVSKQSAKITNFFALRKRRNHMPETKMDVDFLGKKLRKGVNISDLCSTIPPGLEQYKLSALGVFDHLPWLLFDIFASSASVPNLVRFSQSSRECGERVLKFLRSPMGRSRFIHEAKQFLEGESTIDPFFLFGKLIKTVTCTRSTTARVDILAQFYESVCEHVSDMRSWGRLFGTLCSKWDFSECERVVRMAFMMDGGRIGNAVQLLISGAVGEHPDAEITVRNWLNDLFMNQETDDPREASFWLSAVLRSLPTISEQSRLFMIMFAPTHFVDGKERINWRCLCDQAVASFEDSSARISPLSKAIQRLNGTRVVGGRFSWSNNDLFNMIEEISTCPEPWSFDNFVALLLHEPVLIPISLAARMTHGYEEEAGLMLNSMRTLLHRWNMDAISVLSGPMTLTMKSLTQPHRRALYVSVLEAHLRTVKDLTLSGHIQLRHDIEEEMVAHNSIHSLLRELTHFL